MKLLLRLKGLWWLVLVAWVPLAAAQVSVNSVRRIEVKHVGPPAVSDDLIKANIRVKAGDSYQPTAVDDDVRNLYATGFFYNVQVTEQRADEGIVLTYVVQGKPRLTDIKFAGNKKYSDAKLKKKLTSKPGEPLDEHKLFNDSQAIHKLYEKVGYPRTEVKYVLNIDESAGRGTATFEINESPKVKIQEVQFVGAQAFPEKVGLFERAFHPSRKGLSKVIKTRRHGMFSWLTGSGVFKEDQFDDDKEKLAEFYRDKGYIDFEIKDVKFEYPTPKTLILRIVVHEGNPYRVGAVKFSGNSQFSTNEMSQGLRYQRAMKGGRAKLGSHGLEMDVGDTFTPKGLGKDVEAVTDFYGARGYIDVAEAAGSLRVAKIPNTETGTMDLEFKIEEGQKSYIEKIEIRGNTKTKDTVIRRELSVAPGEVFNMVRVKVSKQRLEGLQYFEKIDTRSEPTDPPIANRKNLIVAVEEKKTGNFTLGAGFSSVDAIVGFAEVSQANFNLFKPPTFTGGGQKFRLRVQLGTERQDYLMSFIEPWFLGRKLSLGVDAYHRQLNFQSVENLYDESRTGGRLALTRALGSDFLIGGVSYTFEDVGILNVLTNSPQSIRDEAGHTLLSKFGASLAYDTRNSVLLPNRGQRTELSAEIASSLLGGGKDFYKVELKTAWYFRGFFPGHVFELMGRAGVADAFGDTEDLPFYERYYLGGIYSLRGYRYRGVGPREQIAGDGYEPVGGDTYWFGSGEYSIPVFQQERVGVRLAAFYDIGNVASDAYDFDFGNYSDNWGFGLRLNLPIGPLRLDYGIPITHDQYSSGSGKFQFSVGYTREF